MNGAVLSDSVFPVFRRWAPMHPDRLQLFGAPTPNGVKVSIMLEETALIATLGWVRNLVGFYGAAELVGFASLRHVPAWLERGLVVAAA